MFSDEQMIEIYRARVRLEEYKNSIQSYPCYPNDPPRPEPMPVVFPEHRLYRKMLEVQGIANYAKEKIQEHLMPLKEKGKYTIGEG